ncbi:MAG: 50S ribosomal protein L3 N(5)-glutamine methyltransferase [Halioglobus sp.]
MIVPTRRRQGNLGTAGTLIGYTGAMRSPPELQARPATVGEALEYCAEALEASGACFGHGTDNAWDEAVQLVLAVANLPVDADDSVLPLALDEAQSARLQALLRRRTGERVPLPYLLGRAWFAGLEFRCDERAIIPRSPLAELILNDFRPWYAGPPPRRILDLCCGGGCIGLAAAHYAPGAVVDLVDIDQGALELAAENAAALGLADRVRIIRSDLFAALPQGRYDLILSNPPYVDAADLATMPAEYHHEPERALGSGPDGLDLTRQILDGAGDFLADGGLLVVEVGNSGAALERAFPTVPFTWLEFERGGHGVFALTAVEMQEYRASLRYQAV